MAVTQIQPTGINTNATFTFANVSVTGNVTANNANLGNAATANFFIGSGNNLSNIQAANITGTIANANFAAYAGNITVAGQSNITSVGTLTGLTVGNATSNTIFGNGTISATGNITSLNANLGNLATANFFQGDGGLLTNISASGGSSITNGNSNVVVDANSNVRISISGTSNVLIVSNTGANLLGTFTANGITTGTGSGGNISGVDYITANFFVGTLTTSAQPNITSVGTLTSLSVSGNIAFTGPSANLGTVSNIKITGGTANYTLKTDGAGNLSWTTPITPLGNTTELQFNDAGSFAGAAGITYDSGNSRLSLKNYSIVASVLGTVSGATTINVNLGTYVTATAGGAITWTFTNPAAATNASGFILELTNGGSFTQIWPASVKWPGAIAPTLTGVGVDLLSFITDDGGTTWRGVASMIDSR